MSACGVCEALVKEHSMMVRWCAQGSKHVVYPRASRSAASELVPNDVEHLWI